MRLTGNTPAAKEAIDVVLSILQRFPKGAGASTKDIFRRATPKPRRSATGKKLHVTAPLNPVRSVSYLKNTVLSSLQYKGIIEKIHVKPAIKSSTVTVQALKQPQATKKEIKAASASHSKQSWIWRLYDREASVAEVKAKRMATKETVTRPTITR